MQPSNALHDSGEQGHPKVTVDGVEKVFFRLKRFRFSSEWQPSVHALQTVNLTIDSSSFLTIVGPSGCGKTTLLRILAGLDKPTGGKVLIDGRPVGAHRDGTVFVFQNIGLLPWRSVQENVRIAIRLKHHRALTDQERADADESLALVGLGAFKDAMPTELSGGMQQRLGIARALAVRPDLLLMDEPFGALDAQTRWILQDELIRICQVFHTTVVFITHDIEEAICLGDRVVVMSRRPGRIKDVLTVPFGRERTVEQMKSAPEFAPMRQRVWAQLHDEIRRG